MKIRQPTVNLEPNNLSSYYKPTLLRLMTLFPADRFENLSLHGTRHRPPGAITVGFIAYFDEGINRR